MKEIDKYKLVLSHLDLLIRSKLIHCDSDEAEDIRCWLDSLWSDVPEQDKFDFNNSRQHGPIV